MSTEAKSKADLAKQLNWDKLQLTGALCSLRNLINRHISANALKNVTLTQQLRGECFDNLKQIECEIRECMANLAVREGIKGNYRENLPYEESRHYRRFRAAEVREAKRKANEPKDI